MKQHQVLDSSKQQLQLLVPALSTPCILANRAGPPLSDTEKYHTERPMSSRKNSK